MMINATAGLARHTSRQVHTSTEIYFVLSVFISGIKFMKENKLDCKLR